MQNAPITSISFNYFEQCILIYRVVPCITKNTQILNSGNSIIARYLKHGIFPKTDKTFKKLKKPLKINCSMSTTFFFVILPTLSIMY